MAFPRTTADAFVPAGGWTFRISLRHNRVVIESQPVLHPLRDISGHMAHTERALSFLAAIHGGNERNLVHMILTEHGQSRRGRGVSPRKQIAFGAARRFFPF